MVQSKLDFTTDEDVQQAKEEALLEIKKVAKSFQYASLQLDEKLNQIPKIFEKVALMEEQLNLIRDCLINKGFLTQDLEDKPLPKEQTTLNI